MRKDGAGERHKSTGLHYYCNVMEQSSSLLLFSAMNCNGYKSYNTQHTRLDGILPRALARFSIDCPV